MTTPQFLTKLEHLAQSKTIPDFIVKLYTILEVRTLAYAEQLVQQNHLLELGQLRGADQELPAVGADGAAAVLSPWQVRVFRTAAEHVRLHEAQSVDPPEQPLFP